jgi:RNA recognition motif-containing protein
MIVGKRIFVGNLPHQIRDAELEQLFAEFGTVESVEVMRGRDGERGKGFGFVEMASDAEAEGAIEGLQARELNGHLLTVDAARPRKYRSGGGFGGGPGDGGFRGGYGDGGRGYGGGGGRGRP